MTDNEIDFWEAFGKLTFSEALSVAGRVRDYCGNCGAKSPSYEWANALSCAYESYWIEAED